MPLAAVVFVFFGAVFWDFFVDLPALDDLARREREERDRWPRKASHDVADRGELGRPAKRDQAHRHRLDRREVTDGARRQSVDEAEACGTNDDPEPVQSELASGLPERSGVDDGGFDLCQRRKDLPQVPSQTTKSACFSAA